MSKIRLKYDPKRKSPFQVEWIKDEKRHSRFFETEDEREKFVEKLSRFVVGDNEEYLSVDDTTMSDIIIMNRERGKVPVSMIWEFWKKHHKTMELRTVFKAMDEYIRSLKLEGVVSKEYIQHSCKILERFCDSFGKAYLTEITREDLETWISKIPYSPVTKKNYRSTIRAAWTYFERKEWITRNVATRLKSEPIIRGEIGILTVEETEKLLRANEKEDPEICGLMALGLFAGMRTSAIPRVEHHEINFTDKGILTPAPKTKKKRRDYLENLPDNLWAWLKQTPETAFGWCERKYKKRRRAAMRRAGLLVTIEDVRNLADKGIPAKRKVPPHNCFRHSFPSYDIALHRNFQDTALKLSHKGTNILFEHYRGIAKKEDAEKYFNIYPSKMS